MEKRIPLTPLKDGKKKIVKFSIYYDAGDIATEKGIYLSIHPITVLQFNSTIVEQNRVTSNYTMLVRPLSRKSIKQQQAVEQQIYPEIMTIVRLFQEGKKEELKQLVTTLTAKL